VQVQKPISTTLENARQMVDVARKGGILLGVVSQHRFDDSSLFLSRAIPAGRLGKLLQVDCYVKWHRSAEYYSRPIKGSWKTEGGGALINQAIHGIDIMRWLAGPLKEVFGMWQLGALHKIESEDVVNAGNAVRQRRDRRAAGLDSLLAGVHRAHRIPRHKGDGDYVRRQADHVGRAGRRGRARARRQTSRVRRERSDGDFARAVRAASSAISGRRSRKAAKPLVAGEEGYQALEIVDAVYRSCRTGEKIAL